MAMNDQFMKRFTIYHKITCILLTILVFHLISSIAYARHSMAPSYSYTYIHTTENDDYHIHSPAMNYTGDLRVWDYRLILSASMLVPVWANQNGTLYQSPDYYSHYLGIDFFIGFCRNYSVSDRFSMIPALGWHYNGIFLRGKSNIMDFYSLTSGFGFQFLTKYRKQNPFLNFIFLSIGTDFIDLLYIENKLKRGCTISMGIGHTF